MKDQFKTARKSFPILQEKIQLSSCSQSALHKDVEKALIAYIDSWKQSGMDWSGWMEACENARAAFAKMIHADIDDIAIVSSVSHAISTVAGSLSTVAKNKVYITDFDFPTMGHVWQSYRDKYDVHFMENFEGDYIDTIDYEKQVDSDTLIVNTSHVSFYDGHKQDLKKVAEAVHEKGAMLFVDAYQSLGQAEINVQEMDIDFLASGLQKYALGTPGIAFLYVKKELAEQITPKITGWFGQENPFLFDIKDIHYAASARRFDSGTFPMMNGFAAEAALNILNEFNMKDIEAHLEHLSAFTLETADKFGLTVKSPTDVSKKGSNTAFYVKNASEVEQRLSEIGIIVSARNDVIRVAPHFYNTTDDIEMTIKELASMLNKGGN